MNKKQKFILIAVMGLIAGMFLYPPFQAISRDGIVVNMGYSFIFDPPHVRAHVNVGLLFAQWFVVLIMGGLAFFIFHGSNQKPSNESEGSIKKPNVSHGKAGFTYVKDNHSIFVKKGFNWWALFFPGLWALFKGLWWMGIIALFLPAIIFYLDPHLPPLIILCIGLLYGFKGNGWVQSKLESNGYVLADSTEVHTDDTTDLKEEDEKQLESLENKTPKKAALKISLPILIVILVAGSYFLSLKEEPVVEKIDKDKKIFQHQLGYFDNLREINQRFQNLSDREIIRAMYEDYDGEDTFEEFESWVLNHARQREQQTARERMQLWRESSSIEESREAFSRFLQNNPEIRPVRE